MFFCLFFSVAGGNGLDARLHPSYGRRGVGRDDVRGGKGLQQGRQGGSAQYARQRAHGGAGQPELSWEAERVLPGAWATVSTTLVGFFFGRRAERHGGMW